MMTSIYFIIRYTTIISGAVYRHQIKLNELSSQQAAASFQRKKFKSADL